MRKLLAAIIVVLLFMPPGRAHSAFGEGGKPTGQCTTDKGEKSGPAAKKRDKSTGQSLEKVGEKTAEEAKKTRKTVGDWLWEGWVRFASALKHLGRNIWTPFER